MERMREGIDGRKEGGGEGGYRWRERVREGIDEWRE